MLTLAYRVALSSFAVILAASTSADPVMILRPDLYVMLKQWEKH